MVPGTTVRGSAIALASLCARTVQRNRTVRIAGLVHDPQFGPCVMLGFGGVLAEALGDVVFRVVPLTELDADEMIDELATQKLLGEFRGLTVGDHPTDDVAAENIQYDVQGKARPLGRALQF